MLRGRAVYLLVPVKRVVMISIFIFILFFFLAKSISADALSITATANPLVLNKPIKITMELKKDTNQPQKEHKIFIDILHNDMLIEKAALIFDRNDMSGYAFVPTKYGKYTIVTEDITYGSPIVSKQLQFKLQEEVFQTFVNTVSKIIPKIHLDF